MAVQSHSPAPASAPRCAADSYTWSKVTYRKVLAGVSEPQEVEIPAHGSAKLRLETQPVRDLVARVTAGTVEAGVNPRDAVTSLEEKTGEVLALVGVGNRFRIQKQETHWTMEVLNETAVPDRGRFLHAVVAQEVAATFSAACPGGVVRGTLTTWAEVGMGAEIKCGFTKYLKGATKEAEHRACASERSSQLA
ncbi:hypothetical protein ACFWVC_07405 [Streptomyces sp. NPDC058691]|uniref:hypothetical protein n=1 Tax=Streptomyces sp. NPDC058691 TaxID=3346601 RepID=UPI00365C991D